MRGAATLIASSSALLLVACGSAASVAATPTPTSVLAQGYLKAASKANKAQDALYPRLRRDCQNLDPCKPDFAELSQIEKAFVNEIRAMKVPTSMQADLRAVLDIERRRIDLTDDAAQATSLNQITQDYNSFRALDNQFGDAIDHIRLDLGLPAAPILTPGASPSASA